MVHCLLLTSLFLGLAAISWIDYKTLRIPDILSIPLILLGLLYGYLIEHNIQASIIGAITGYAVFFVIEKTYLLLRGFQGLGRGDAKLLAVGGAWSGIYALPTIILVASATAIAAGILLWIFKSGGSITKIQLPFGPFLALGILYATLL